jgi:hypothetical protein
LYQFHGRNHIRIPITIAEYLLRRALSLTWINGKEQTLNLLGPGDPFGMCTAFAIDSFPANDMALEESGILLIAGPAMEAIAMKEPRLLLNIIRLRKSAASFYQSAFLISCRICRMPSPRSPFPPIQRRSLR